MKSLSRALIASLAVSAAWLTAGSVAEAVPPLPHSRIDNVNVSRQQEGRIEMIYVLPEWARAELAGPLSVSQNGRGYFARSVPGLKETFDLGAGGRGIRGHERGSKKSKRVTPPRTKRGGPGAENPTARGKVFENQPILPEPLERAFQGRPGGGTPTPAETPEPSSSALLAIALMGWLGFTRPGRPR